MVYPYNGMLFSHLKNGVVMHTTACVNPEHIVSERHPSQEAIKAIIVWFHSYEMSGVGKSIETEKRFVHDGKWE